MARKVVFIWITALLLCACEHPSVDPGKQGSVAAHMTKSSKRGVAFNFKYASDLPLLSPYISWDYNWGNTADDLAAMWFDANEMDFCPMCWNGNYNADKIRSYVAAHPNTKYLLAFNEPNLTDQARMTPAEAAAIWAPVVALSKELNLKLVSPAMNYGTLAGYSDPIKWLDEFFVQPGVSIDDIYAISVHCYMASANGVKNFIERFEKYNKPIWLTEFCAWDPVPGSVSTQMDYMCAVLHYLEQAPTVERYAWFIPRTGGKVDSPPYMQLLTHDDPAELTELGKIYCGFTSYDTKTYLSTSWIAAGSYIAQQGVTPNLRPANDDPLRELELPLVITNISPGMTMDYQVSLATKSSSFAIRTAGYTDMMARVYVDDKEIVTTAINRSGGSDNWTTTQCSISSAQQPTKGLHTVRIEWLSGNGSMSGFSFQ
ncbi:MAG: hypothetical protein J5884_04630 [Paludibacteraceae bacterium]|nr:hypothetical protein [Paludibacteraceae bacterium]